MKHKNIDEQEKEKGLKKFSKTFSTPASFLSSIPSKPSCKELCARGVPAFCKNVRRIAQGQAFGKGRMEAVAALQGKRLEAFTAQDANLCRKNRPFDLQGTKKFLILQRNR